jgi:hypothetical protein
LSFEANRGQTAAEVYFLSRGSGYALFLTPTETVLSLQQPAPAAGDAAAAPDSAVLRSRFVGANPQPQVVGLDRLAGTSNYLIGDDPSQWQTNIANYSRVEYENLYTGVDLVFYGNQRQLEYDYVVAPGADPAVIKLAVDGAESMTLDGQGDLLLHTSGGNVLEHAPVVYQDSGGVRQPVSGQFVLEGDGQVSFALGAYDHREPLVIDPVLSYSTYLGGSGYDIGYAIAVDNAGNAYVTGTTGSANFPTTTGALQATYGGNDDVFVTKLNRTGTAVVYSTYLGGASYDYGYAIAVDNAGNAYVTGTTGSANFPTTTGALQATYGGNEDVFVTKLNRTGTALVYSTYLGGTSDDRGEGIAVDAAGNVYVTGYTGSSNFPTTPGAYQTALSSSVDAFVAKLNPTGTALVYSTYLGGSGGDEALGIAVDNAGDAYVTGDTDSTDFPTTPGAYQTALGGSDAFVTKLNPTGTALLYSTYLGGTTGDDYGRGIAVDAAGNAYVTGYTYSTDFPTTPGAYQLSYGGGSYDVFVTKLNRTGTALVYSTYLGGTGNDLAFGIAVDAAGNAYVTGYTYSTNFPATPGAYQTALGGDSDAFVAKLNPTGTALVYSTYLGGTSRDWAFGIAVDAAGNAYVTGNSLSTDFPTTPGAYQTSSGGNGDVFVTKFAFETQTTTALTTCASPSTYGDSATFTAAVTDQGNPVTSGTVDFKEGDTVLASMVPLSTRGTARFSISSLSAITHTITAFYSGASGLGASSGSVQQVVNKKAASVTPNAATKVFGSPDPALTGSTSGFLAADGVTASFSRAAGETVAGGPYIISATLSPSGVLGNYAITYGTANFTITARPITVTASSATKVYGAALSPLTYTITGFVNGDTASVVSGSPVLSTTATASSHVLSGPYSISISAGTLWAANYSFNLVGADLAITPAPLTITADSKTKVYGASVSTLTASYNGWVNGDTTTSLTTPPTLNTAATASSHVRAEGYTISASGASDPDYTISYWPGTLTITPAPLTITANNASKIYGAALPALTASYTGFVNGESAARLAARPVLATTAAASSPVQPGGYAIIASGASDPDYTIAYQPGTLLITPAALTTTANNATMVQGAAVPLLSASYSGFVNGDSPASLSTPPTLTTPATPVSPPGTYAILVGGASSPNYAINYGNGILVVTPAPVKVLKVSTEAVRVGKTKKTTQVIVLQFTGSLNVDTAQSIWDYSLTTIPANKRQKSQVIALSQARYNAATNTVTLFTRKPLVLNPSLKLTYNLLDAYNHSVSGSATIGKKGVVF